MIKNAKAMLKDVDWRLYMILDPSALEPGVDPLWIAQEALAGGAGVLQLRDKRSSARASVSLARALARICASAGVPFIVNDRLDVAIISGADGVHLGPKDLRVDDARALAPGLIIGASAGDPIRALELESQGADYLGCGAVFDATASKPDASPARGVHFITQVRELVSIPVVGIGGITIDNGASVIKAGADGIAVIRAISEHENPREATRLLLQSLFA